MTVPLRNEAIEKTEDSTTRTPLAQSYINLPEDMSDRNQGESPPPGYWDIVAGDGDAAENSQRDEEANSNVDVDVEVERMGRVLSAALQFARAEPRENVSKKPMRRCIVALPQHQQGRKHGNTPGKEEEEEEEECVQFVRAYAKELNERSVPMTEFLAFVDGLNILSSLSMASSSSFSSSPSLSSTLDLVREASSHPPLVRTYLALANDIYFAPRGLEASVLQLRHLLDTASSSSSLSSSGIEGAKAKEDKTVAKICESVRKAEAKGVYEGNEKERAAALEPFAEALVWEHLPGVSEHVLRIVEDQEKDTTTTMAKDKTNTGSASSSGGRNQNDCENGGGGDTGLANGPTTTTTTTLSYEEEKRRIKAQKRELRAEYERARKTLKEQKNDGGGGSGGSGKEKEKELTDARASYEAERKELLDIEKERKAERRAEKKEKEKQGKKKDKKRESAGDERGEFGGVWLVVRDWEGGSDNENADEDGDTGGSTKEEKEERKKQKEREKRERKERKEREKEEKAKENLDEDGNPKKKEKDWTEEIIWTVVKHSLGLGFL